MINFTRDKSGKNMADEKKEDNTVVKNIQKVQKAVLYKKLAFLPLKTNLDKFKKISTFSAPNMAQDIKQINSEDITKNIMSSANETVNKQRSKKNRWLSFIFLSINIIVLVIILWVQLSSEESVSFEELVTQKINWWWLLLAFGFFMLINITDGMRTWVLIKFSTGRSRPWLSYKSVIMQRFYDSITPLATGGQPFQVFYLNKRGLSASSATSVPLGKYMFGQFTFLLFFAIIIVIKGTTNLTLDPIVMTLCYIGILLNFLLIASVLFLSVSKKMAPSFMIWLLRIGKKMHIVKDYRREYVKVMKVVREYVSTSRKFMSNSWIIICELCLSILFLLLVYSIPYLIYLAFGNQFDLSIWVEIMVMAVVCDLAVSFVPIPGGAGTAELSFKVLFAGLFSTYSAWAILFWRLFTYYGYLLQGVILMLYDFVIGNKKIKPLLDKFKEEDDHKSLAKIKKEKRG